MKKEQIEKLSDIEQKVYYKLKEQKVDILTATNEEIAEALSGCIMPRKLTEIALNMREKLKK